MSLISKKTDKGYLDNYNRCSWVRLYYGVISKIIKENNFKKCAEIGIGYGFHAKEILMNSDVEMLYLVDPYVFYPNDGFATDVEKFGGFEKLEKNVKINLEEYSNRYKWFKQPSLSITNEQITDESLDLVFIDGDHSYESVQKDLRFWWKKVRKGGWLTGDDYRSCFPSTTKAVNEFSKEMNLELKFKTLETRDYPIYYFIKPTE